MRHYYLTPIVPTHLHVHLTHANIHQIHASLSPYARVMRDRFPLTRRFGDQIVPCGHEIQVWSIDLTRAQQRR